MADKKITSFNLNLHKIGKAIDKAAEKLAELTTPRAKEKDKSNAKTDFLLKHVSFIGDV